MNLLHAGRPARHTPWQRPHVREDVGRPQRRHRVLRAIHGPWCDVDGAPEPLTLLRTNLPYITLSLTICSFKRVTWGLHGANAGIGPVIMGFAGRRDAPAPAIDLEHAPYGLYGVKYIDLVSLAPFSGRHAPAPAMRVHDGEWAWDPDPARREGWAVGGAWLPHP